MAGCWAGSSATASGAGDWLGAADHPWQLARRCGQRAIQWGRLSRFCAEAWLGGGSRTAAAGQQAGQRVHTARLEHEVRAARSHLHYRGARREGPWRPGSLAGFLGHGPVRQDGGLLVAVQAQRLPAAGTSSAEAESVAVALRDPEFRSLLVSNGIRAQAVPVTLAGHEPQNRLRAVASQRELIEGFSDFKKNLTPERLPFVSPGGDHPAEPQNLFERLVASADRGVLLVGAAGTGKTRTGIEVGLLLEAGWRVLHVLPGEDESVTDQIAEQVLAEPSAVLVVVDYLNESLLDLPALRHRLIPEAHRRGIPVALLASVRPGWLNKADRALLHGLFDEVELRQDGEFQRLVTDNALTTLAPTAIIRLGPKRMLAACGHRPIIALLVASEIERRVKAGLAVPEAADLRSGGELLAWLERRLSEDGLVVPAREDDFIPARASHALVAAAAAAGACPQSHAEVVVAARAALDGAAGKVPDAEDIVATLVSLGWLELDNGALSVAHDVVADQFMESVILPERDADPDLPRTRAMLARCSTSPAPSAVSLSTSAASSMTWPSPAALTPSTPCLTPGSPTMPSSSATSCAAIPARATLSGPSAQGHPGTPRSSDAGSRLLGRGL